MKNKLAWVRSPEKSGGGRILRSPGRAGVGVGTEVTGGRGVPPGLPPGVPPEVPGMDIVVLGFGGELRTTAGRGGAGGTGAGILDDEATGGGGVDVRRCALSDASASAIGRGIGPEDGEARGVGFLLGCRELAGCSSGYSGEPRGHSVRLTMVTLSRTYPSLPVVKTQWWPWNTMCRWLRRLLPSA